LDRERNFALGTNNTLCPVAEKDDPDFDMTALRSAVAAILGGTILTDTLYRRRNLPPPPLLEQVDPPFGAPQRVTW
jgi:hypothetical protein